ncbi:4Fe-4S single cluster domain-containing protein [Spirochaeta cellobiosiphila]|uniref:4Fe-4S single cluster domain-containing protein n=1 Tax=Spirochaeta cellobiosiphila TaxID=504483 RepID=UPI00042226B1|nr:4Fe-4S single cluster domain-containing protein [Spirochaeta cellobiosiphila]
MINLHSFIEVSEVNGPGKRSVFWVQGCHFNCPGCRNQAAIKFENHQLINSEEAFLLIPIKDVEGVTFSGGEPFLQAEALIPLATLIKEAGLNLLIYSGYTREHLESSINPYHQQLLSLTDILIDGLYRQHIPSRHPWAGSGNQKVHYLSDRAKLMNQADEVRQGEIHITNTGDIIYTGIFENEDYL